MQVRSAHCNSRLGEDTRMEKPKRTTTMILATAMLLLPAMSIAGNLEPGAVPGPTMKTLDQIPPTWSRAISGSGRFESLGGGGSALDKETGLVWTQQLTMGSGQWSETYLGCYLLTYNVGSAPEGIGGRAGWRLPTCDELATLHFPYPETPPPYLPDGHPFNTVQSGPDDCYWTSTTSPANPDDALAVRFGTAYPFLAVLPKTSVCAVACVRGGR